MAGIEAAGVGVGTGLSEADLFNPDIYAAGDAARNGLPHDVFDTMRAERPCARLPCAIPGHEPSAWALFRYEDVAAMLRDPTTYLSGQGVTCVRRTPPWPPTGASPP